MKLLLVLISAGISIGNSLVLERDSPGLVPSMHWNNVNEYAPDLTFVQMVGSYPLMNSAAALTIAPTGDVLVAEPCDASLCYQIMRYRDSGATPFGRPIDDVVRAMEVLPSGDVIVLLGGSLGRIDAGGRWIGATPLPAAPLIAGFDVDRDQCTAVFAALDRFGITNICEAGAATELLPAPGNVFDVRFLSNGHILAAGSGAVYELDRHGTVIRSFVTSGSDTGRLALDPDGASFQTTAANRLFRFDLTTGDPLAAPVSLRTAAYGAISMAIRGEWRAAMNPIPRRRSVLR